MKSQYVLPITIVVAGVLIAGAVFLVGKSGSGTPPPGPITSDTTPVPAPTAQDHILGNPSAAVVVIEYSDLECPYCKIFHGTMHQIMAAYGTTGNVAWVFRNMPLTQIHKKAQTEAEATECAAELGGNDAFWKYTDRVFEATPSEDGLDLNQLPQFAKDIGLDVTKFNACLASKKYAPKMQQNYNEAVAAGAQGTPFTVITMASGSSLILGGAQSYSSMRSAIDQLLQTQGVTASTTAQ